jgi:23S rRNA (pseudouridine1915-N3)-methyltransferase
MRLIVAAVGRLKSGAERPLFEKYRARCEGAARSVGMGPIAWHEVVESRASSPARRRAEEATALLQLLRGADATIALDPSGKMLTSVAFAQLLRVTRDGGAKALGIMLGGADGLASEAVGTARLTLSFGAITLPHQLARIVLAEQLYRAATILAGHPYHRD